MAEIPLRIKAEADTSDAVDSLEELQEATDGVAEGNESAAESAEALSDSVDDMTESAGEAAEAQAALAQSTEATATAATASAASLQQAGQGLRSLNQFAGQATLAVAVFRSKIDEMREASERANVVLREQAVRMGTIAGLFAAIGARSAAAASFGNVGLQAGAIGTDTTFKEDLANANSVDLRTAAGRGGRGGGAAPIGPSVDDGWQDRHMTGSQSFAQVEEILNQQQAEAFKTELDQRIEHQHAMEELDQDSVKAVRTYYEQLDEINKGAAGARERMMKREEKDRAAQTQATVQWMEISGGIIDQATALLGMKEGERLILKGLIHVAEGTAELIGSYGANPQGWAHLAQGGFEIAAGYKYGSSGAGRGGGGSGAGAAAFGGGGGVGAGGAFASTGGGGGGGRDVPETIVINQYGLLGERDAGDKVAGILDGRRRRTGNGPAFNRRAA